MTGRLLWNVIVDRSASDAVGPCRCKAHNRLLRHPQAILRVGSISSRYHTANKRHVINSPL